MTIRGLHHASITTADRDRLVSFYRDLLGFEVFLLTEWKAGNAGADAIYNLKDTAVRMAMLRLNGMFLEIFQFDNPAGKPNDPGRPVCDGGFTHICLNVDDIHGEYARLKDAGVRFHCPPQTAAGLCIATYARDPDGNIVELMQPDPSGPFAQ
jgi:catechol 2,3-dioxygenase-like lactoylglutathione lyase family enzyme